MEVNMDEKSIEMSSLLEAMGGRTTAQKEGRCARKPIGCERKVDTKVYKHNLHTEEEAVKYITQNGLPFRDQQSLDEYGLSALCQECQDSFFHQGMVMEAEDDWS